VQELEFGELGVEFGGDFGDLFEDLESLVFEVEGAEPDGLEFAQDAGDFAGFPVQAPLAGEAGADPVGEEADADMVDDALGLVVEDGADFEVAFEFAEGFFDFEEVFVVGLDLGGVGLVDGEVGVKEIPTVVGGFGGDGVVFAFPVEVAGFVDAVGEVFVGFEALEGAAGLAGEFLGVGLGAFGGGEFGEGVLGFVDAERAALLVAVFAPGAAGEDMAFAVVLDFEEAVGVGEFELGVGGESFEKGFEGGVGEAGDEFEAFVFEGLEVDFAAHAAVEDEDGVLDLKASAQDLDGAAKGGGVGAVAAKDGDVEGGAVGVGGDGEEDLGAVGAVVAAVAVAGEVCGAVAFEVDAGEVVEGEGDGGLECLGGEFFFQGAPVSGDGVHGGVEVVFVEGFIGGKAAGLGEQRASGGVFEGEFGGGEEEAGEDHGFEEGALARGADVGEEAVEVEGFPGVDEDGEAAEVEGGVELEGVGMEGGFAGEVCGDELAEFGWELGDVGDGAGAGAFGGAEGLADEVGGVGFAVLAGFGGLDKHELHKYEIKTCCQV